MRRPSRYVCVPTGLGEFCPKLYYFLEKSTDRLCHRSFRRLEYFSNEILKFEMQRDPLSSTQQFFSKNMITMIDKCVCVGGNFQKPHFSWFLRHVVYCFSLLVEIYGFRCFISPVFPYSSCVRAHRYASCVVFYSSYFQVPQ